MILRVFAMWNQSKWVLWVFLVIYMPQVIISLVVAGIYDNPNTYLSGVSHSKLHISFESHIDGTLISCNTSSYNGPSA